MNDTPIHLPPEATMAIAELIDRLNPEHPDLGVVVVVAKKDLPPSVMSTIPPDKIPELFQWLIDHHGKAEFEVHSQQADGSMQNETRQ